LTGDCARAIINTLEKGGKLRADCKSSHGGGMFALKWFAVGCARTGNRRSSVHVRRTVVCVERLETREAPAVLAATVTGPIAPPNPLQAGELATSDSDATPADSSAPTRSAESPALPAAVQAQFAAATLDVFIDPGDAPGELPGTSEPSAPAQVGGGIGQPSSELPPPAPPPIALALAALPKDMTNPQSGLTEDEEAAWLLVAAMPGAPRAADQDASAASAPAVQPVTAGPTPYSGSGTGHFAKALEVGNDVVIPGAANQAAGNAPLAPVPRMADPAPPSATHDGTVERLPSRSLGVPAVALLAECLTPDRIPPNAALLPTLTRGLHSVPVWTTVVNRLTSLTCSACLAGAAVAAAAVAYWRARSRREALPGQGAIVLPAVTGPRELA
jgi:hypothetical protein